MGWLLEGSCRYAPRHSVAKRPPTAWRNLQRWRLHHSHVGASLSKLESHLAAWSGRKLSFQGKSVIINTLALSQIWHLCHIFPLPKWAAKGINTAVWTFFWPGKRDLVARSTVSLPKSQGGFGVINFNLKAQVFALQWLKRYFTPDRGKWKSFFTFFISSSFGMMPCEALLSRHRLRDLPPFYHILFQVWRTLDGSLVNDGVLSVLASMDALLPVDLISSQNIYALLRSRAAPPPHCMEKFQPTCGPLHWPQTWSQLHLCHLDRIVIDLNWQIAHGVLYTGATLAHRFHMHVDPCCFCAEDDETLEHLFFECELACILVAWVYFHFPSIIIFMLLVLKHTIWVARCDFRFRDQQPVAHECLSKAIAKLKFVLRLLARWCRSPSQIRVFEREWLAHGSLRHFEGEELVFSF